MKPWEQIEKPEEINVGWRTIVKKVFNNPDGDRVEFFTKDKVGTRSVAVIAVTSDNRIVVNEMFRPGPNIVMFEIPGGGVGNDEDLQTAGLRELQEETGYTSKNIIYLGKFYKDAWGNAENHYFFARDCKKLHEQKLDAEEFIISREITIDDLFYNAKNGLMTDSESLLLAYDKLMEVKNEKTN